MAGLDIDNKSLDDLLNEADEKLKAEGIDPNGHPDDDEEGANGGLQPEASDESAEENAGGAGAPSEGGDGEGGDGGDGGGQPAATATDESGKQITFSNAEELSTFVAQQIKIIDDGKKTPEQKQEAKDKLESMTFFEEGYRPADWNVAMREIIKNVRPIFKQMDEEENKAAGEKIAQLNAEFDAVYDELAKSNSLPARGTPEGKEVDRQITAVGAAYGVTDYRKAHDIWSRLPKETEIVLPSGKKMKAGGLDYKPTHVKKPNPSKEVSRLQSVGKGGASNKGKAVDYKTIHGKSMDDLLEEDL